MKTCRKGGDRIKRYIVAITGASGVIYAQKLLCHLADKGFEIFILISDAAKLVIKEELGVELAGTPQEIKAKISSRFLGKPDYEQLHYIAHNNLMADISSGSTKTEAMLVVPCSMGSLARIAHGISNNLVERAADITLKEGRPLIIAPRETPLNLIHIENMLKLAKAGARIIPCMPAFYQHPASIDELANFMAGRLLDALGVEHQLYTKWGSAIQEPDRK